MSNILNHNRSIFDVRLNKEDYWDFHLSLKQGGGTAVDGLTERCLSAYVDTDDADCVWFDDLYSKGGYVWDDAVSGGVTLEDIGYTGVDNGLLHYDKSTIDNERFIELFTNSTLTLDEGDKRLKLSRVYGNNSIYDYYNEILYEDGVQVAKLNGGFYQGFFKLQDRDYKVLPTRLNSGWCLEFELKPMDFVNESPLPRLNDVHPDNAGIFCYIGTRAENKWYRNYTVDETFGTSPSTFVNGYSDIFTNDSPLNSDYVETIDNSMYTSDNWTEDYIMPTESGSYALPSYVDKSYSSKDACEVCGHYFDGEYLKEGLYIDENMELTTSDGFSLSQANIYQYETDNKFILFNHAKGGFTTDDWDEDDKVVLHDIKVPELGNFFTMFHHAKGGYTASTIGELIESESNGYSVLKDLYRNAIAFQIKEDGSVGYKYLVKDCDSEDEAYKVESEFGNAGAVTVGEWHTVNVKIVPKGSKTYAAACEAQTSVTDEMRIYIYVDGKLKLVSKWLPMLNLKALDDLATRQEGVPFNISVGGGTQGLCDVIYTNYRKLPEDELPLEKEFAGSFIGFVKSFKFYDCPLNFTEISANYVYERNFLI